MRCSSAKNICYAVLLLAPIYGCAQKNTDKPAKNSVLEAIVEEKKEAPANVQQQARDLQQGSTTQRQNTLTVIFPQYTAEKEREYTEMQHYPQLSEDGKKLVINYDDLARQEKVEITYGLENDLLTIICRKENIDLRITGSITNREPQINRITTINSQGKTVSIEVYDNNSRIRVNGLPVAEDKIEISDIIQTALLKTEFYLNKTQLIGFIAPAKSQMYNRAREEYDQIIPEMKSALR